MSRRIAHLMIGPAALAALFVGAAPAVLASTASAAPALPAYGGNGPTVGLSSSTATFGSAITLSATGCKPDESFVITIHSVSEVIGHAESTSAGDVSASVVIPSDIGAGNHTITMTGNKGDVLSSAIVVAAAVAATGAGATTTGSSGLAFTGTDAIATAGLGAGTIGVGGLLVLGARRRRRSAWTN